MMAMRVSNALHFYMNPGEVKCFYENLVVGNLVIGDIEGYVKRESMYVEDPELKMRISVDESFDNNHRVMNQKNGHSGDFTFTALDTGEHRICFMPSYPQKDAKLRVFMELDIVNVQSLDSRRKDDTRSLKQRVLQLVRRLEGIRIEQKVIREKEALFRNQSESANSRILLWSTLQILGLVAMCGFQIRYLKNFFVKQKVI
ncbi:probable protein ERP5 [Zygosaccharomyces bailii ISA1307]|nr:probable protein ERP5 [Zygosaccharomyces bailii ISA1307]